MRILVLDQDKSIRESFCFLFEVMGVRCDTAASADEVKSHMRMRHYDFIFLDICLDLTFSLHLIPYIREHSHPTTFIIAMSALSAGEQITRPYKPDMFIRKPFNIELIEAIIHRMQNKY